MADSDDSTNKRPYDTAMSDDTSLEDGADPKRQKLDVPNEELRYIKVDMLAK